MAYKDERIKVCLSVGLKVNLGSYESAEAHLNLSNVPAGATDREINEAIATGKLTWEKVKSRLLEQVKELRELEEMKVIA